MPILTPDFLKNVPPERGKRLEFRDEGAGSVRGLIFRVTANREKSWSIRYRSDAGEQRRQALGEYPSVGLAEARRRAKVATGEISAGGDPVLAKREEKVSAERDRLNTFGTLATEYFEDAKTGLHRPGDQISAKRPATLAEELRVYERHVKPKFGKRPLAEITRDEIQKFIRAEAAQAPSRARASRNIIRQIMSYAEWKQIVPYNVALKVAAPRPVPKTTVISDDDLRAIWSACRRPQDVTGLDLSPEMGFALRMALVTLQRGQEIVGMRWAEIDRKAKTWLIPAARMKGKREHLVPLSDMAVDVLDEVEAVVGKSEHVFASPRGDSGAMDRRSFSRAMARVVDKLKIAKATPHDFRRTGATNMTSERIGIPRFIVSQVIAHAGDTGGAAAVTGRHYDMHDYLPEKRRALDAWAALLQSVVTGEERPSNVTTLPSTE